MAGVQRPLGVFPVRYVAGDRENALLAVNCQRPRRHQAGDDRSVLAAERSLEPCPLALARKNIDKSLPVGIAYPYAQTAGRGRLPDHILRRVPGDLREPFVYGQIYGVRHPGEAHRVGTDMKGFRVFLFRIAQRAVSVVEPERHRDRGEQHILPRVLQHIPVVRDPPGPSDHLPFGVRGEEYDGDILEFEDLARRISAVHPLPEIDIHQYEVGGVDFLLYSGDCPLRGERRNNVIPRPLEHERLAHANDRVILDEEYFLHDDLLTELIPSSGRILRNPPGNSPPVSVTQV